MSKVSKELAHLAAKRLEPFEFYEYSNKIANLVDMKPYKSTKNAKNAKTTVKTAKNDDSDSKLVVSAAVDRYLEARKTPVSTPDPNEAFRWHKRAKASKL
jgi:hypothetical protein